MERCTPFGASHFAACQLCLAFMIQCGWSDSGIAPDRFFPHIKPLVFIGLDGVKC